MTGSALSQGPGVLLERADDLARLHQCATTTADTGHGRVALVYGEAGIGKTALLRQFESVLPRRFTVVWGACDPLFTPRPLGPLLAPAEELGGEIAALVMSEARPHELAGALLAALRGSGPSVLVLEDLQWADEATLDVVRLVARQLESAPTLMIWSFRNDCLHRTHPLGIVAGELPPHAVGTRVELGGLSLKAVGELVGTARLDAEDLHARTAGNPFYVTEVLAAGGVAVPESVRDAVLARVARLSRPARDLLDAVAVVPQRTEVWLLEAIAGGDLVALDECLHSGVLRAEADGVVFRHELARQAVEGSLSPGRAVVLHRAALAALASDGLGLGELARLAHHAEAAGDGAAVLRYAPAAGEQAASLGAPREAERQYMRALRFAGGLTSEERSDLQKRFAEHAYLGTMRAEAAAAMTEAIVTYRRAGDPVREGSALLQRAKLLGCIGRAPEARADVHASVLVLGRATPGAELAQARRLYASYRSDEDLPESLSLAHGALMAAEQTQDPEAIAKATGTLGAIRVLLGDADGLVDLRRDLTISLEHGFTVNAGTTFINLAAYTGMFARWKEAARVVESGIEFAREHGLDAWLRCLLAARGLVALALGHWDRASDTATELLANPDDPITEVRLGARVSLALVRARRGDPGCWSLLDEALRVAEANETLQERTQVAVARAEAAWLDGRTERIAGETDELYEVLRRVGHSTLAGEIAVWRRRAGIVDEDLPAGSLPEHTRLLLADDGVGAARILEESGARHDAALALIDTDDAKALRNAHAWLRELGAAPAAARAARHLRELGEKAIPRGPTPRTQANAAGLTARELEVLPLLAEGLHNAEIARRLIVSPKTVDHHVSAILRKLGVRSRSQAASAALRLGLIQS